MISIMLFWMLSGGDVVGDIYLYNICCIQLECALPLFSF